MRWEDGAEIPRFVISRPGSTATSREYLSGTYQVEERNFHPIFVFSAAQNAEAFLRDRRESDWEPRQLGDTEMVEWLLAAKVFQGADVVLLDVRASGQLLPTRAISVGDLIEVLKNHDQRLEWVSRSFSIWFR